MIIGGGVSGLAAANALDGVDLTVLEAGETAEDTSERITSTGESSIGPPTVGSTPSPRWTACWRESDSVRTSFPPATARQRDGSLPMAGCRPRCSVPPAFLRTSLLPWWAKLRVMLEPLIPRGRHGVEESVADFVRRRLGQRFVDRMVGPMVAGIYAAKPEELSLASAFPKMVAMEKEYRSLFLPCWPRSVAVHPRVTFRRFRRRRPAHHTDV